ncbi:ubiquitin carboxyl-terminal hydrolase 13 [Phtheirospermum japonicum]|uniref:Ubiquitin carboxyl-terminal hydrolase 13 n=1 Tax=Phtheirospermum japonicum TaxID=374723 RepID=A0A830CN88_9LAMI|nr:ubiquitin carboxyl-terminal hydrolase 13 [Phtheirospermum japonicum]
MKNHHHSQNDVAVSSSDAVSTSVAVPLSSHRASEKPSMAVEDPLRDAASSATVATTASADSVVVERRGDYSALCKWTIANFPRIKSRALWSKYFEVGGFDCRLLIYPKGDSQALPGYLSIYLQIMDPRNTASSKWDCFASYRLAIDNLSDPSKSVHRDSWHRFSSKKKSHGWCDFASLNSLLDPKVGFLHLSNDCILITTDILILHESFSFSRDNYDLQANNVSAMGGGGVVGPVVGDVLSGKFTWKVHNFSLFKEMIKTQKIMSPVFPAGDCNLRISVYQSVVNGVEYLSMCLESKDTEKNSLMADRSCWCLFRMSVLNQKPGNGSNHVHRDSYGRFAADNKSGDNTSLGWNDYMKMADFIGPESGFLVEDTAVFSTSFHVIKELSSFSKSGTLIGARNGGNVRKSDGHLGKFTWRIENFTRLKDLLKKRKITGLCIKSRRFQIGNRDCRLIVYPRGQSQPPCHLSVFLEVTDSRNTNSDWSCFVSHRLSVVNQRMEEKSVTKESQNRYSKAAKDWGWREFVTLTSLFDQDSGFLVQDTVIFSAEVLILKETSIMQDLTDQETYSVNTCSHLDGNGKKSSFTWRVENFLSFKEIMETRKIFSKFFQAGGCELRIGVYESFDTICIYLESEQSVSTDPDKNFWVRYRMAIVNQKNPSKTVWKESSICTKTWNNSVLQFMKVSDMLEADAGFLLRDTVVFVCEILDCCPWFEFSDLEVFASEDDQDALSTDPDELIDSDDSDGLSGDEEDIFRNLLSRAGFHLTYGDNSSQPQVTLREKLLMDAGAIAGFLTGLRVYLDDPAKVKRLLLPTKISGSNDGSKTSKNDESSPSLMNLLMGVKVLQQAIIDLLLDIMVECCQPSEGSSNDGSSDVSSKPSPDGSGAISPLESDGDNGATESSQLSVGDRFDLGMGESKNSTAVQSSDLNEINIHAKTVPGQPICPPETSAAGSFENPSHRSKTKWPEQSEELLGLIVNSLRALDGAVPQGCPEPRRRPQSAQKIALVLDKAPKHLQPDLVALVPKLVEHSEHSLAACALLDRLQKPDAEPALRLPVFGALSQLECSSEVWERVLLQSLELLGDCNDEPLAATVDFIFKAALHCQHLPEAVRSVRVRLKNLGSEVSPCVLDYLSRTVTSCADIAESILRDIDCDDGYGDNFSPTHSGLFIFGENGSNSVRLQSGEDQTLQPHFSDIYILIEILSVPCLAVEAAQIFERAVARGAFVPQSVSVALERRLARRLDVTSQYVAESFPQPDVIIEGETIEQMRAQRDDYTSVLGLAETLALSRDKRVKGFVKILYTMLFKQYADESHRLRMLKRLVDRVTTAADASRDVDLDMEILVVLVSEDQDTVRPVLSMMREVAELANVDRAALWHQLCASEDDVLRIREERKVEFASMSKEKAVLSQRLSESEATSSRLKSEMRAEMDRFARERKELIEQVQEVETQLEWVRSERDDEITKLMGEKKTLQDRLYDAESQLSQLKSRKRDELKRVMKEKNALAERLKSAEAARKRFDEELKRFATENVSREEIRQSLEDEVRRLTQTVGQTEGEKREKEEQVARCEAYIDGMELKLQACEQYIHHLEGQLQEEMSRHAPLYGAGLEALSMKELETISRIHEEGLRQIHAIQQRKGSPAGSPLVSPHNLSHNHGMYPTTPPPMAVGLPPPLIPNGVGIHSNGHVNGGGVGPWFNH